MLQALRLKPVQIDPQGYIPSVAEPLFAAAKNGEDLVPVLTTITRLFGFDYVYVRCKYEHSTY